MERQQFMREPAGFLACLSLPCGASLASSFRRDLSVRGREDSGYQINPGSPRRRSPFTFSHPLFLILKPSSLLVHGNVVAKDGCRPRRRCRRWEGPQPHRPPLRWYCRSSRWPGRRRRLPNISKPDCAYFTLPRFPSSFSYWLIAFVSVSVSFQVNNNQELQVCDEATWGSCGFLQGKRQGWTAEAVADFIERNGKYLRSFAGERERRCSSICWIAKFFSNRSKEFLFGGFFFIICFLFCVTLLILFTL